MSTNDKIKILPGSDSFETLIQSNAYYVDKTHYLKKLLSSCHEVENALFTRPRRFGKTLNLSMIKAFCELNYQKPGDTIYQHKLFIDNDRNLAVAKDEYKELRDQIMGQIPVIYVSFKGVEGLCFPAAIGEFLKIIYEVYNEFLFLEDSSILSENDKRRFKKNYDVCTDEIDNLDKRRSLNKAVSCCKSFISTLALLLHKEFKRQVLILIDEYDVPLQKSVVADEPYYDEMLDIIRSISISVFKQQSNPWLYKSIVTACVNVTYSTEIGDTCNICSFDVSDEPYTAFFGYTQDETDKVLASFNALDKKDELKKWYGGYRFGHDYVYCPDSVLCYCQALEQNSTQLPQAYGTELKDNALIYHFIKNSIKKGKFGNISELQALMDGKAALIEHYGFSSYPNLKECTNFDIFAAILLHKGYLTYTDSSLFMRSRDPVSLKIPNLKIRHIFEDNIVAFNADNAVFFKSHGTDLLEALMHNDTEKARKIINAVLKIYISLIPKDTLRAFYVLMQNLLTDAAQDRGISVSAMSAYDTSTDDKSYSSIVLDDEKHNKAVILEFKLATKDNDQCYSVAREALDQISDKRYADMFDERYTQVYCIGIGFFDRFCSMASLSNMVTTAKDD